MPSKKLTDPQMKEIVTAGIEANEPDPQKKEDGLKGILSKLYGYNKAQTDFITSRADMAAEKFGDLLEASGKSDSFTMEK